jgi:hypothetical protein
VCAVGACAFFFVCFSSSAILPPLRRPFGSPCALLGRSVFFPLRSGGWAACAVGRSTDLAFIKYSDALRLSAEIIFLKFRFAYF